MLIKQLIDEDFVNYKVPSMFIGTSKCSFKCEKEYGKPICQNSSLALAPILDVDNNFIVERYIENPITKAIVIGGLEPFDSFIDTLNFIKETRIKTDDDIVIYSGYKKEEIKDKIKELLSYKNIIIKFGRFLPNKDKTYDKVLGIYLASNNQYAERISLND